MTTTMRWDPFQDLRSAQDEMAQMHPMLAHALSLHTQQGNARATAWAPALDISERTDAYLVAEGIQASLEDGVLQLLLPKAEEAKSRRIQVRPGQTELPAATGEGASSQDPTTR